MDAQQRILQRRFEAGSDDNAQHWLMLIRLNKRTLEQARLSAILGDAGAASLFRPGDQLPQKESRRGKRKKARARVRRAQSVRSWLLQFASFDTETQSRVRLALGRSLLPFFVTHKRGQLEAQELLRRSEHVLLDPGVETRRVLTEGDNNFYWAIRGHHWVQSFLRPVSNRFRRALQLCTQDPPASFLSCFQSVWEALELEMIQTQRMKNGLTPRARQVLALRIRKAIQQELRPWAMGTGDPLGERRRLFRSEGGA